MVTVSFHLLDQTEGSHVGPVFVDEVEAGRPRVRFVNYGPAFWDVNEAWPKRVLAFIIDENMKGSVFIIKWIRHDLLR
jgi:hypothetical protein